MKAVQLKQLSTIGQRFETSRFGEVVISCLVVVVLLTGVVWSLPDADIKHRLIQVLQPVASAAGLEQSWRMYAPEPLQRLEFLEVRVTMTNGVQRVWTNPRGDPVIGVFAWYHWQKVKENVVHNAASRVDVAHWAVRRLTNGSEHPARVQMILRTELLAAPGANGPTVAGQEILYDENLIGKR